MRVLCIGDSNTNGFDPRSYIGEGYPEGVRWTDRIHDHEMINWGINGITIPGDTSVYVDLIKRKDPDLIVVMLGTNDILEGMSAAKVARRMESFLDSIRAAGSRVLLIAPPPLVSGECVQSDELIMESEKLSGLYKELAASRKCLFADAGKWGIDIAFDGVHLSPEGHKAFASELEGVLNASL